jgi:phosphatidylglycerol:prolipoprotein diacylglycerol transferase
MASLSLRGRGLPISHLPPTRLVARGPYALMRHPIYAGYAAAFAGAGAATGSAGRSVGATAVLLCGSLIYALGFEEPRLTRRYGQSYRDYVDAVPAVPLPHTVTRAAARAWDSIRPWTEALANHVVLLRVGPVVCVTYGAFAGLGAAAGLATCHALLAHRLPPTDEALFLLGLAASMLAGARVVALLYRPALLVREPSEALRRVGFVSWGGYLGMFAFPFLFASVAGGNPWWLLDRACLSGLVCSCIGRVGCLAYGCCYGRPAERGICWRDPEAKMNREGAASAHAARIPTQLLSAACAASLVPVVLAAMARGAPGVATLLGSLLYSVGRFGIECLRDEPRFGRWAMTRGQIASAFFAAACIALLLSFPGVVPAASGGVPVPDASRPGAWLAVVAASLLVFLVYSVHWKRVGRW